MDKECLILRAKYGTAFFNGEKLVHYVHENDGDWRREYFNPVLRAFGIKPRELAMVSSAQAEALKAFEGEE